MVGGLGDRDPAFLDVGEEQAGSQGSDGGLSGAAMLNQSLKPFLIEQSAKRIDEASGIAARLVLPYWFYI